jgi:hypothetical protein
VEIEGDDVISAAISGQHVIYLQVDGDVNYYNIVTQEKKKIGGDEDYYLVTSGGGGNLLVAELGSGGWRLHRYDANAASPQLTRLTDDYDITFIRTRDTGREIGSGKNKKVFTSDLWTLFE